MDDKQTSQSYPRQPVSADPTADSGKSNISKLDWKKIAIFAAAGLVLFLLKDLIMGLVQFTIMLAILAGLGIVGYSALQLSKQKNYALLAQTAQDQLAFLERKQYTYHQDSDTLLKDLQNYFLEKTWGISGLRWRINNCDLEHGKIVADFECCESASGELLPASTSYSASPPKSFGLFPALLPSKQTATRRYVTVKISAMPATNGGTILDYSWDFRYTEQADKERPDAIPTALFQICKDVPQSLADREL